MAAKKKVKKTGAKGGGKVIIAMLRRANGCTREEVLKETGWSAVSFQQQAKAAGIKLKIDKSVRPFRYKEGWSHAVSDHFSLRRDGWRVLRHIDLEHYEHWSQQDLGGLTHDR
jgi:hypothetical protein